MDYNKKNILKKILAPAILLVLFVVFCCLLLSKSSWRSKQGEGEINVALQTKNISIGRTDVKAELALNERQWFLGLSNRQSICEDCGMLFVFPEKYERQFVMRNMLFPLDIVFLADDVVINIEADLPPEGPEPGRSYRSAQPADKVLELNAGFCKSHGIKIGDKLSFKD